MSGRILIADDAVTNRLSLSVRLGEARYQTEVADDFETLLKLLDQGVPDLVILSEKLGPASAIETTNHLRSREELRDMPILLLSSCFTPLRRLEALVAGVDDVLPCPFSDREFMSRVRALLRSAETRSETVRRQQTADKFGFAEVGTPFEMPASVTLVSSKPETGERWLQELSAVGNFTLSHLQPDQALDATSGTVPVDAYVVECGLQRSGGSLAFVSDLRSRARARHAAIILGYCVNESDLGASALDLGANDVFPLAACPGELTHRLQKQLSYKRDADNLRKSAEDGIRLAATDPLTGLYNRRYALAYLERAAKEAVETGKPFAVMVADLDHFKNVNDTYGHRAGDLVLQQVALLIRDGLRSKDLVARIGGEEFLIAMPGTDQESAMSVAQRLRSAVANHAFDLEEGTGPLSATISIGVSTGGLTSSCDAQSLIDHADAALYDAKSSGRNKVGLRSQAA